MGSGLQTDINSDMQNNDVVVVICDLDNTLIFTDDANNQSYIEVMGRHGYDTSRLQSVKRVTSKYIHQSYPNISKFKLWQIKRCKLKTFMKNLYLINLNGSLMETIYKRTNLPVVIWTSSNRKRALAQIKYFNIKHDWIVFSQKDTATEISRVVSLIKKKYKANRHQILFYEDDLKTLSLLREIGAFTIKVQ